MLPFEVSELSAHFRQIVGWNETVKRFLHEQNTRSDSNKGFSPQTGLPSPSSDHYEHLRSDVNREEQKKDRIYKRMTAGGGISFSNRSNQDNRGRDEDNGHPEHHDQTEEDTEYDSEEGPGARNCLLMDEGGDIEAEQEEEDVDNIANDLEVW